MICGSRSSVRPVSTPWPGWDMPRVFRPHRRAEPSPARAGRPLRAGVALHQAGHRRGAGHYLHGRASRWRWRRTSSSPLTPPVSSNWVPARYRPLGGAHFRYLRDRLGQCDDLVVQLRRNRCRARCGWAPCRRCIVFACKGRAKLRRPSANARPSGCAPPRKPRWPISKGVNRRRSRCIPAIKEQVFATEDFKEGIQSVERRKAKISGR